MATQTKWDMAGGLAGVLYLLLVLFGGIQLPVMGVALVLLAGYSIIRPHRSDSR